MAFLGLYTAGNETHVTSCCMFSRAVLRAMTKRKIRTSCAVFKMRVTRIMRKAWQGVTPTASSQRNWQVGIRKPLWWHRHVATPY